MIVDDDDDDFVSFEMRTINDLSFLFCWFGCRVSRELPACRRFLGGKKNASTVVFHEERKSGAAKCYWDRWNVTSKEKTISCTLTSIKISSLIYRKS